MEAFGGRAEAISHPGGWAGQGADSFATATGQQGAMLRARGSDLRAAGGALNSLSVILESAQERVKRAAIKRDEAKEEAREAAQAAARAADRAREARAAANSRALDVLQLGAFDPLEGLAQAAQADAADAADRAARAADKLERVERWARREVEDANADVRQADRAVAGQIGDLGQAFGVPMGSPIPTAVSTGGGSVPISALAALGRFLGATGKRARTPDGGMLAGDETPLPVAKRGDGPQELRQLALLALAGDGLRSGLLARGKGLGHLPGIVAVGPLSKLERRLGGPPGRTIDSKLLPAGTRNVFTNPALRTAARYGIPGAGLATGGLLDYMNSRAEGDSAGRAAREAGIVGATTLGGSWLGGAACGVIGTATLETGGWGYASCPVLVPGFGYAGQKLGERVNWVVDQLGL